jgi:hypothetical protein
MKRGDVCPIYRPSKFIHPHWYHRCIGEALLLPLSPQSAGLHKIA